MSVALGLSHSPLPQSPSYRRDFFPPHPFPRSDENSLRRPLHARDLPIYIDVKLSHSCWKYPFKEFSEVGSFNTFSVPSLAPPIRKWEPYALMTIERPFFSEALFASNKIRVDQAKEIAALLKEIGARILYVSQNEISFEEKIDCEAARVLVPNILPKQAPLPQETLDKAASYLRGVQSLPEGEFIVLGGEYYWGDASTPYTNFHRNIIQNFSEKSELGKSIRYVYPTPPEGSRVKVRISACYFNHEKTSLVLERRPDAKTNPARWGIPGGANEPGEGDLDAAIREGKEETGIDLRKDFPEAKIEVLETVFVTLSKTACFAYTAISVNLPYKPTVTLAPKEHVNYKWITLPEARAKLGLIDGEEECFDLKMMLDQQRSQKEARL